MYLIWHPVNPFYIVIMDSRHLSSWRWWLFCYYNIYIYIYIYMKWHQTFTEKFYGINVEGPRKRQNINDSFKVWFENLSSIKFFTECYLISISYHKVISGYKYTEYNITTLTQYNVIILIELQKFFFQIFYHWICS